MKYEDAKNSVLGWVASDLARDIDDAQFDKLVQKLTYTVKDLGIVISPEAVNVHAEQLFPELFEKRVVPPREQPKQTKEQAVEVIRHFLNNSWHLVAPGCLLPIPAQSKINHAAFFDAVNAWAQRGGLIRADYLADITASLFQRGALEKPAAPPEVIEPPAPPTPRELEAKRVQHERSLQNRDTSPIRGAREAAKPLIADHKPVLTEEQRVALNEKKRSEDSTITEAQNRIQNYASYSHSKTYSHRAQLQEVFRQAMDEGVEAKEVLRCVDVKIDQLAGNASIR